MRPTSADRFHALVLVGPTAIGKSLVAHRIAQLKDMDILSADSMAVYRGMDVGTDKPTPVMRREVRYFGIDLVEPVEHFSVGRFYDYCRELIVRGVVRSGRLLVVGGSGLYVKALTHGIDPSPATPENIRREVQQIFRNGGIPALLAELQQRAPEKLSEVGDLRNPRRLMRAVELARLNAATPTSWRQRTDAPLVVGLKCDRHLMYKCIEERVDRMLQGGLINEVAALKQRYGTLSDTARQAIGYNEVWQYLEGRLTWDQVRDRMIRRTRELAKRQMTWFRHQERVRWVEIEREEIESAVERILAVWQEHEEETYLAI